MAEPKNPIQPETTPELPAELWMLRLDPARGKSGWVASTAGSIDGRTCLVAFSASDAWQAAERLWDLYDVKSVPIRVYPRKEGREESEKDKDFDAIDSDSLDSLDSLLGGQSGRTVQAVQSAPPLIELPDGSWIDPLAITGIRPIEEVYPDGTHPSLIIGQPRLAIECGLGYSASVRFIPFGTFDEVKAYARDLGRRVNLARAGRMGS